MRFVVHPPSLSVLLLGAALLAPPLLTFAAASPVLADCGTDGIRWPDRPKDVRGAAFIGTALQPLDDVPEPGARSIRFSVDRVLDGAVGAIVDLTPVCVETPFVLGQRYLVSTTDTLFAPGAPSSEPTPGDGHLWFTDGTAVAWRIVDGGGLRLLGYGEGAHEAIPAWVRAPGTVQVAVRALLPSGGDPDPVHPVAVPFPDRLDGATMELLALDWGDERSSDRTELRRTTIEPAAAMPPTRFAGEWLTLVERGVLTVTLHDGRAVVLGADGTPMATLDGPGAAEVRGGESLRSGPDAALTWENRGTGLVTVLSSATIPGGDDAMTPVDRSARAEDPFEGPVMGRIALTGDGQTGDRYRITIADRSARVIGARVPTERELRFAGGGDPAVDFRDLTIGPVATLPDGTHELLVGWRGTPCGPIVTLDVAQDLSALRVLDRTGGCDAAGVGHRVILHIRGEVPDPRDIAGTWVRR